jgi:hypothetical protein
LEAGVNQFDVIVEGQTKLNASEVDVAALFSTGRINRTSPCRIAGTKDWRTVDELLPLLKWWTATIPRTAAAWESVSFSGREQKQAMTSAIKAGWICLVLGLPFAWIFPPAHTLLTVSLMLGIIAMATHQVGRGLALTLSSIFVAAVSTLVSFLLAVGLFAKAVEPAVAKAKRDMDNFNRQMQAAMKPLVQNLPRPLVTTSSRSTPTPQPVMRSIVSTPAQTDLLPEISRMETRQRDLRRQNRDLDEAGMEYLNKLRMEYDRVSVR